MKLFVQFALAGLLIAPNAFSQIKTPSTSTTVKKLSRQSSPAHLIKADAGKKSVSDFEMDVPGNYKSKTKWSDVFEKIEKQNKDFKKEKGGFDLGGGASVIDPTTNKRRLLDLAEKESWDYISFLPVNRDLILSLSPNMAYDISERFPGDYRSPREEFEYFRSLGYYIAEQDPIAINKEFVLMGIAGLALTNETRCYEHGVGCFSKLNNLHAYLGKINRKDVSQNLTARLQKNGRVLRWMLVDFPLENLNDEGFISLLDPTTKRQVAIQKDGVVIIQRQEYAELDNESKAALFLHESVLFAVLTMNPDIVQNNGTAPIRKIVRRTINYQNLFYSEKAKREQVDISTFKNYRQAIEDAVQELIELGL